VSVRAAAVNTSSYAKVEKVRARKTRRWQVRNQKKGEKKERPLAKQEESERQREREQKSADFNPDL
jgi:hypothetical protein